MSWRDLFKPPAPPALAEVGSVWETRRAVAYCRDAAGNITGDMTRAASWRAVGAVGPWLLTDIISANEEEIVVTINPSALGTYFEPVTLSFTPERFGKYFKFVLPPNASQI